MRSSRGLSCHPAISATSWRASTRARLDCRSRTWCSPRTPTAAVVEFLESGDWKAFDTVQTLANAMDVGDPSNMERLRHMWPDVETVRQKIQAFASRTKPFVEQIRRGPDRWSQVWDPHTACAAHVRDQLDSGDWIIVATAHPAKFNDVVEPILQREVSIPAGLAELLERPNQVETVAPELEALQQAYLERRRRAQ